MNTSHNNLDFSTKEFSNKYKLRKNFKEYKQNKTFKNLKNLRSNYKTSARCWTKKYSGKSQFKPSKAGRIASATARRTRRFKSSSLKMSPKCKCQLITIENNICRRASPRFTETRPGKSANGT